jgi:hypothetical protein
MMFHCSWRSMSADATQAADLLAGRYYINIHTANNGGGEIRCNLVIPEPSSIALLSIGILGFMRRWR